MQRYHTILYLIKQTKQVRNRMKKISTQTNLGKILGENHNSLLFGLDACYIALTLLCKLYMNISDMLKPLLVSVIISGALCPGRGSAGRTRHSSTTSVSQRDVR